MRSREEAPGEAADRLGRGRPPLAVCREDGQRADPSVFPLLRGLSLPGGARQLRADADSVRPLWSPGLLLPPGVHLLQPVLLRPPAAAVGRGSMGSMGSV